MRALLTTVSCLILCVGCGSLNKPYPEKNLHALHVASPSTDAASATQSKMVLRVDRVILAEPYSATTFIYQVGDSTFKSDYYNGFVAPPSRLLTGEVTGYLARAGLFRVVFSGESEAEFQFSLESNVTSMYGDYREGHQPAAVVTVRFFVIDQAKENFAVIFDKTYSQTTPIEGEGTDALIKTYETCWTNVLTQLAGDLRNSAVVTGGP